ncbi:MAG: DUF1572 family protein [Pirellulaceae bacterium]
MADNDSVAQTFLDDASDLLDQSVVKIRNCLEQLSDQQIWWRHHPESNSAGNLVLHICGNLRQWAIAGVGGEPEKRDRDSEFAATGGQSGSQLLALTEQTVSEARQVFQMLKADDLLREYVIQGFAVTGLHAISHTTTHFVGHTHQIIFLTRMQLGADYRFAWSPGSDRKQLPI